MLQVQATFYIYKFRVSLDSEEENSLNPCVTYCLVGQTKRGVICVAIKQYCAPQLRMQICEWIQLQGPCGLPMYRLTELRGRTDLERLVRSAFGPINSGLSRCKNSKLVKVLEQVSAQKRHLQPPCTPKFRDCCRIKIAGVRGQGWKQGLLDINGCLTFCQEIKLRKYLVLKSPV